MELLLFLPCLILQYLLLLWAIRSSSKFKSLVFLLLTILTSVFTGVILYKLELAHLSIVWFHIGWFLVSRRKW